MLRSLLLLASGIAVLFAVMRLTSNRSDELQAVISQDHEARAAEETSTRVTSIPGDTFAQEESRRAGTLEMKVSAGTSQSSNQSPEEVVKAQRLKRLRKYFDGKYSKFEASPTVGAGAMLSIASIVVILDCGGGWVTGPVSDDQFSTKDGNTYIVQNNRYYPFRWEEFPGHKEALTLYETSPKRELISASLKDQIIARSLTARSMLERTERELK